MSTLKIAIQKSGRLNEDSIQILKDCGISINNGIDQLKAEASNFPLEVLYLRNSDIPQYLIDGVVDIAIVGDNLLVEKGIKSVVVATLDPNPLVAGKGVQLLEDEGISVAVGLLEQEARWQNRRFFCQLEKHRPYLILKWAQTQDGFLARENKDSKWISGTQSRQLVHQWRAEEQAILVGKNTALHDNPRLNVRDWTGSDPIRVVLDSKLELPADLHLFDQQIPTLCYNTLKNETLPNLEWVQLPELSLATLLSDLQRRHIQSVLIEGGSQVLQQFLAAGLWDEARVFTSPLTFERGIAAPTFTQVPAESYSVGEDQLDLYYHG